LPARSSGDRLFRPLIGSHLREAIPSITTGHELTCDTPKLLWDEVRELWHGRDMTRAASRFTN
jgi:hypothetical protein